MEECIINCVGFVPDGGRGIGSTGGGIGVTSKVTLFKVRSFLKFPGSKWDLSLV